MSFDLVLDNGTILDGSGRDGFAGAVGVSGGRIAAIGDLAGAEAARPVDSSGRTVAPGFTGIAWHTTCVLPQPQHANVLRRCSSRASPPSSPAAAAARPRPTSPATRPCCR